MKQLSLFSLIFLILLSSCQKDKWNRRLAVKSGRFKLTKYTVNEEDKTTYIPALVLNFKNQDAGQGEIVEFITTEAYSAGYNSFFNVEGAVTLPNATAAGPIPFFLAFTNKRNLEDNIGLWEVNHPVYGSTRSFKPITVSRTKLEIQFPYNLTTNASDTNQTVREVYTFEKLP